MPPLGPRVQTMPCAKNSHRVAEGRGGSGTREGRGRPRQCAGAAIPPHQPGVQNRARPRPRREAQAGEGRQRAEGKRSGAARPAQLAQASGTRARLAASTEKVASSYDKPSGRDRLDSPRPPHQGHQGRRGACRGSSTTRPSEHQRQPRGAEGRPRRRSRQRRSPTPGARQRRNLRACRRRARPSPRTHDRTGRSTSAQPAHDATESLQSFDANRAVDRLKGAQALEDQPPGLTKTPATNRRRPGGREDQGRRRQKFVNTRRQAQAGLRHGAGGAQKAGRGQPGEVPDRPQAAPDQVRHLHRRAGVHAHRRRGGRRHQDDEAAAGQRHPHRAARRDPAQRPRRQQRRHRRHQPDAGAVNPQWRS